ncbi:reverse transcriptase [Gossypium australe]|uniref:Reverse transcriptase n=1 Tax=Gossypium australe TaxID=47621 RepID=A0A5B6X825_9ROSI|nr:reverse transcriptase [Gossypium australe]
MALVGWDSICQPKMCGGLGLKNFRDQNISLLMKLGFKLVSDKEAFWARVLRSKYRVKDDLPVSIVRDRNSFLWKSLSKIWALFRENLHWSVLVKQARILGLPASLSHYRQSIFGYDPSVGGILALQMIYFEYTARDTGVCLCRVAHGPLRSVPGQVTRQWNTGVPGGRMTNLVTSLISHGHGTRACLVAV